MPFSFRRGKRARAARSQGTKRRAVAKRRAPNFASKINNIRTGGFLGLELKFKDSKLVDSALAATNNAADGVQDPTVDCLNGIGEGSGENERTGRKAIMKSCEVQGQIESDGVAGSALELKIAYFYVALVLDTQTNAAQMVSELCYKNVAALIEAAASPFPNLEQQTRFKILKQIKLKQPSTYAFNDAATTGAIGGFQIPFGFKVNMNVPVTFTDPTADVSSIMDNSLHIVSWTSNLEMSPKITYASRVRFLG